MKKIRLAVVGLGNMGSHHCKDIAEMEMAEITAVCDINPEKLTKYRDLYNCEGYSTSSELLEQCDFDGIVIATPHYDHTTIAIEAFARGFHVLTEKPVGVHVKDIKRMISAYEEAKKSKPNLVFAAMFQQRTRMAAGKIKELIDSGELGKLIRTTWIVTDWLRTQHYYDTGEWRATWKGEGGGVLMNQCPHQLDMYQWFVGCPDRVTGFASLGKYHHIEVEDEVTAYFEYDNGMVGHFITTTGEWPGTNRLEIIGELGKLIWEDDTLTFHRLRESVLDHINTAPNGFAKPEIWKCKIPINKDGGQHRIIMENFCRTILGEEELIAPAGEGMNSIAMDNAIMLSSFEKKTIELPLDDGAFEKKLEELKASSTYTKTVREAGDVDMSKSF